MTRRRIIATGTYAGNGSSQSINVGWQPSVVIIASTSPTAGNRAWSWKSIRMFASEFEECSTGTFYRLTNGITITSSGFSVGSRAVINESGTAHHYAAWRLGRKVAFGAYVGNGAGGGQAIAVGKAPDLLLVANENSGSMFAKTSRMGGSNAFFFGQNLAGNLATFTASGFTALGLMNSNLNVYSWAAFFADGIETRNHLGGGYQATGSGEISIATGRQPKALAVFDGTFTFPPPFAWKTDTMPGDDYGSFGSAYSWLTTGGPTLTAAGFNTGANQNQNTNGIGADDYIHFGGYL